MILCLSAAPHHGRGLCGRPRRLPAFPHAVGAGGGRDRRRRGLPSPAVSAGAPGDHSGPLHGPGPQLGWGLFRFSFVFFSVFFFLRFFFFFFFFIPCFCFFPCFCFLLFPCFFFSLKGQKV